MRTDEGFHFGYVLTLIPPGGSGSNWIHCNTRHADHEQQFEWERGRYGFGISSFRIASMVLETSATGLSPLMVQIFA